MNKINKSRNSDETISQSRRSFLTGKTVAPTGSPSQDSAEDQIAQIANKCLALDGIACQICGDICEPRAIKFFWAHKKVPMPLINEESCTGCGDCLSICPASAILLVPTPEKTKVTVHAQ